MRRIMEGGVVLLGVAMMFVGIGCACCPRNVEPSFVEEPVTPPPPPPRRVVVEPLPTPPPEPTPTPTPTPEPQNVYTREGPKITIKSDVTFESGSAVVKADARAVLIKLAQELNGPGAKDQPFTITGHTDSDRVVKPTTIASLKALGKSADNMGLSEARAEAVAAVLKAGGVEASRMTTLGKGESEPVADNRTPAGKARNRRVEIYLKPAEGAAPGGLRPVQ